MHPLLEVIDLTKKYDELEAVKGISLSIDQGICFGLLGPNGAGKTTTIEVIEDIIKPSSGEILYKGKPRSSSFNEQAGIQFQETALLSHLTVKETLQTFKSLYPVTSDIDELVELCHLEDFINQYNDKISGGQKQRFLLALALINKPELLFLDEPSTGLDPQARRNLWDIVYRIKDLGKTIILTTHYMEEAEFLCDKIAIMDRGKIIARGSPEELIKTYCKNVSIILPEYSVKEKLEKLSVSYKIEQDKVEIKTDDLNSCLNKLMSHHIDLTDMIVRSPNLENVFLNLTGRQLRE